MGTFSNVNTFLRTLVLAGLVGIGGWWTLYLREKFTDHEAELRDSREQVAVLRTSVEEKAAEIEVLGVELEEAAEEIVTLETAKRLLTVDHRLAKIDVVDQATGEDGSVTTRVRFTELDGEGQAYGEPLEADIDGNLLYVETLVIKFEDDYVEQGDALRGSSVCIFKRLFGEDQRPSEGVPIDAAGQQPPVYASDDVPLDHIEPIWQRFWDYANDAELAESKGVRAIHGEAPFVELRPGKSYDVELRSSGGVSIRPRD